jgi:hypothetical protein
MAFDWLTAISPCPVKHMRPPQRPLLTAYRHVIGSARNPTWGPISRGESWAQPSMLFGSSTAFAKADHMMLIPPMCASLHLPRAQAYRVLRLARIVAQPAWLPTLLMIVCCATAHSCRWRAGHSSCSWRARSGWPARPSPCVRWESYAVA